MDQFKTPGISKDSLTDAAQKAHVGVDRVADKASAGVDRARAATHQSVDQVAAGASRAADWATENLEQIKRKQADFTQEASDMISARPLVAVGTAVVIGYLLGRIGR